MMAVRPLLCYVVATLAVCVAEMVSWRTCPCNYIAGYGSCARFIDRRMSDNTIDLNVNLQSCNIDALVAGDLPLPKARWVDLRHNRIRRLDENVFKQLTDVKYLSLEHNNIRGKLIHPNAFKSCRNLRGIGLAFNDMRDAPDDLIEGLHSLQQLFLYNSLLVKVPAFATKLANLDERLELSNNEITLDNNDTFSLLVNLRHLLLDNNRIEYIPANIFKSLTSVIEIKLNHNKITRIPEQLFAGLARLKYLFLNNNLIEYVPQNMIEGCISLQEINLAHNKISHLPDGFLAPVNPKKFDFSGNPFQCACLNEVLVEVKKRHIAYNSDDYDGRTAVCVMNDFLCHRN